jgi:hypothetical protein
MNSKMNFKFETDAESRAFVEEVVSKIVELFGVSLEEALGRVNRHWKGLRLVGPDLMIYHESPQALAKFIYYGPDVSWWKGEEGLKPLPYP